MAKSFMKRFCSSWLVALRHDCLDMCTEAYDELSKTSSVRS